MAARTLTLAELSESMDMSREKILSLINNFNMKAERRFPDHPHPFLVAELGGEVLVTMEETFWEAWKNSEGL